MGERVSGGEQRPRGLGRWIGAAAAFVSAGQFVVACSAGGRGRCRCASSTKSVGDVFGVWSERSGPLLTESVTPVWGWLRHPPRPGGLGAAQPAVGRARCGSAGCWGGLGGAQPVVGAGSAGHSWLLGRARRGSAGCWGVLGGLVGRARGARPAVGRARRGWVGGLARSAVDRGSARSRTERHSPRPGEHATRARHSTASGPRAAGTDDIRLSSPQPIWRVASFLETSSEDCRRRMSAGPAAHSRNGISCARVEPR